MWTDLWTWIRHNIATSGGIVLALLFVGWLYGCESKTTSLVMPGQKVTRPVFLTEVKQEQARLELEIAKLKDKENLGITDLAKQDELKAALANTAIDIFTTPEAANPASIVLSALSILGFGAILDNRIKDKLLKRDASSAVPKTT